MSLPVRKFDYGRDLLKVIAVAAMVIDHIGYILYPGRMALYIVGRLSFPIFAYLAALGIESTKKPKRYLARFLTFALISQIPCFLAFGLQPLEQLNILFSLLLGALTVYL